jgi:HD-GYP domain-containing protein (c-di-GMP phosphodiesterase class II)
MKAQLKTDGLVSRGLPADQTPLYASSERQGSVSDSALRKQVEKLNQIGIALSSETNLERLLELIVREARAFTKADAGSLYILDQGMLYFHVAQNDTLKQRTDSAPGFKPYPLPLSKESIAGYVAITGEILNIENVYHLPKSVPYHFNPDFDLRNDYLTRSMLVVPMKDGEGQRLGVLQLINAMGETGLVVPFQESVEHLVMSLASQAAVAIRNAKLIANIKALFQALIRYSTSAIDARSPHTAGHSRRVAAYSEAIAAAINDDGAGPFRDIFFTPEQMEELDYAAWLHDIGKIGVPEQILDKESKLSTEAMGTIATRFDLIKSLRVNRALQHTSSECKKDPRRKPAGKQAETAEQELDRELNFITNVNRSPSLSDEDLKTLKEIASKTYEDLHGNASPYLTDRELECLSVKRGNLTDEEYKKIQTHVEHTYNIVKNIPFTHALENVPFFSASHHEFLDGTGYPRGLTSDELPLQARILAVADIFDALTAVDRPYRSAISPAKACQVLEAHAEAGRLDQDIVHLFTDKALYNKI